MNLLVSEIMCSNFWFWHLAFIETINQFCISHTHNRAFKLKWVVSDFLQKLKHRNWILHHRFAVRSSIYVNEFASLQFSFDVVGQTAMVFTPQMGILQWKFDFAGNIVGEFGLVLADNEMKDGAVVLVFDFVIRIDNDSEGDGIRFWTTLFVMQLNNFQQN